MDVKRGCVSDDDHRFWRCSHYSTECCCEINAPLANGNHDHDHDHDQHHEQHCDSPKGIKLLTVGMRQFLVSKNCRLSDQRVPYADSECENCEGSQADDDAEAEYEAL